MYLFLIRVMSQDVTHYKCVNTTFSELIILSILQVGNLLALLYILILIYYILVAVAQIRFKQIRKGSKFMETYMPSSYFIVNA